MVYFNQLLFEKREKYEIVVGERRYRASQEAGLDEIPAVVRELNDATNDGNCYFRKSST